METLPAARKSPAAWLIRAICPDDFPATCPPRRTPALALFLQAW